MKFILLGTILALCACVSPLKKVSAPEAIRFSYFDDTFMVVPVRINGGPPRNFIFDTGIGVNVISKSLCQELRCKTEGEHIGKRMSGQEVRIPMSELASLSLGSHELKNAPVGVFDLEAMMPGAKIDGFLSLGFFKDFPYTVDYVNKVLIFESADSLQKVREEGERAALRIDHDGPAFGIFMPLTLPDGQRIEVEVDTGSQSLILEEKFMKPLGISAKVVRHKDGRDETGHSYKRYFTKLRGTVGLTRASAIRVIDPDVMFQKIIYDGLVGQYFLREFRVTYDLPRKELIFKNFK